MRERIPWRTEGSLLVLAVIAAAAAAIFCSGRTDEPLPAGAPPGFDTWLGAQCAPGLDSKQNMEAVAFAWECVKRSYRPILRVINGRDLQSRLWSLKLSPVATYDRKRGCITSVLGIQALLQIDPEGLYVFGEIQRISQNRGATIWLFDAQIMEGPLKGAIIHLRNGSPGEGLGPYYCLYKIPRGLEVSEGVVPFKVVMLMSGTVWDGDSYYRVNPYIPTASGGTP